MLAPKRKNHPYRGRTTAYRRFRDSHSRTRRLLDTALFGVTEQSKTLENISATLKSIKGALSIPAARRIPSVLRQARQARKTNEQLRFHFYALLAVYLWATYETYLSMLFEELRTLVISDKETIAWYEAAKRRENLFKYLIKPHLDQIKRYRYLDQRKYLEDWLKFRMQHSTQERLDGLYLIRNIVAHNTGVPRSSDVEKLPKGTSAKGGNLRIRKQFLISMLGVVERVVTRIEKHVDKKFYR